MRRRWLSPRAAFLHVLVVLVVPGCLFAGWWQVHRALSGNLLSYFYSVEWPIFAILGVVAWWQLLHDVPVAREFDQPSKAHRSWLHRDEEVPSPPLAWDKSLETPELMAYNRYLAELASGGGRKTWRNPRGLPFSDDGTEAGVSPAEARSTPDARLDKGQAGAPTAP